MIAIVNGNGLTLQLTPGQNLLTELATNWLSDEELPSERSYAITAPLNDNNKRFVGHGYRPDRVTGHTVFPVTLEMEGTLYRRCQFAYKVQAGQLNAYLKIDSAEFFDKIRKLTLLEALPDVIRLGNGLNDGPNTSLPDRMKVIAGMPPGSFPLTFFPIRNEAFLEESFSSDKLPGYVRHDYVNFFVEGRFVTDTITASGGWLVVPQLYLWWVLQRIMALAGYQIESDWLAQTEVQRWTVFNQTAMAVSGLGLAGDAAALLRGHTIVAGMHLPDMQVSDFLKAIKTRFSLNIDFNGNTKVCTISQFKKVVDAGPSINLTPYQTGPYDSEPAQLTGYTIKEYLDESDELNRNAKGETLTPPSFVIGDGQNAITLKCGTTQLISLPVPAGDQPAPAGAYWFVPTVKQPGNVLDNLYKYSECYPDEAGKRKNNVGLKLLSYRGMVAHSGGAYYPLATPGVKDGLQQVVGTQALTLAGKYGAWQSYLRDYYYWRDNTEPITQGLLLPVSVLASLQKHRSVQLSLEDQILRSYLISKIQAQDVGASGLVGVKLTALSRPPGLDLSIDADQPVVWLDFVLSVVPSGSATQLGTISVKAWADASRTTPASVISLGVVVRTRKTLFDNVAQDYVAGMTTEYLNTYYVTGTGTIILDTHYLGSEPESFGNGVSRVWNYGPSLDPGEGYNILRS